MARVICFGDQYRIVDREEPGGIYFEELSEDALGVRRWVDCSTSRRGRTMLPAGLVLRMVRELGEIQRLQPIANGSGQHDDDLDEQRMADLQEQSRRKRDSEGVNYG